MIWNPLPLWQYCHINAVGPAAQILGTRPDSHTSTAGCLPCARAEACTWVGHRRPPFLTSTMLPRSHGVQGYPASGWRIHACRCAALWDDLLDAMLESSVDDAVVPREGVPANYKSHPLDRRLAEVPRGQTSQCANIAMHVASEEPPGPPDGGVSEMISVSKSADAAERVYHVAARSAKASRLHITNDRGLYYA